MLSRIANLVAKDLRQLSRDRLLAAVIVIGPVLELVLVASSTSAGIHHLPMAVVDLDGSPESRRLVTAFGQVDTFDTPRLVANMTALKSHFDRDRIAVALVIPPGFGGSAAVGGGRAGGQLLLMLDGTEPAAAEAALSAAEGKSEAPRASTSASSNDWIHCSVRYSSPATRTMPSTP